MRATSAWLVFGFAAAPSCPAADEPWVEAMRAVHKKFNGEKGAFACFGDSITVSMAFWASLQGAQKGMSADAAEAFTLVKSRMKPECWRWKGPAYGNQGSMTIRWARENVDAWLKSVNPEVALIMFGTNDLGAVPLEEYEQKTREVVERCLENGTVVILSTIPPRSGMVDRSRRYAEAAARVARDLKVPLSDYLGECLKRRPDDWDGAAEKWREFKDYEVPTLISRDGVHPSNPRKHQGDYSEEGLRSNGFVLRNYITLMRYAEVIRKALEPAKAAK